MAIEHSVTSKLARQYVAKPMVWLGIALALYISTMSLGRQEHIFTFLHNSPKPASQNYGTAVIPKANNDHGQKPWTFDFADYPNGPVPTKYWNFEVGAKDANYNNEAETYTSSLHNARIQDGLLVIEAKPQNLNGKQYTSARVNTLGTFDFTYGTLEVDMMMPSGAGTWPAAWLLPADNIYNPTSFGVAKNDKYTWALNGEIDFAEAIGSLPGQNIPAAHSYHEVQSQPSYTPAYITNPYTEFHRYGVIKTPDTITFTIDGIAYASRHKTSDSPLDWPYNQPYYLILDLAVGGNWAGANGIDASSAPWQLKVKTVTYNPL